jgi:hypothetical protein
MAPGDLVAWHDHWNDRIIKLGLVLSCRIEHAVVLWCDGRVEMYGKNFEGLFGTAIRIRRQQPRTGTWHGSTPCLEAT